MWSSKGWQLKKEKARSAAASRSSPKNNKKELDEVKANIGILKNDIQVADAIIQEGNKQLERVLYATSKHIPKKELQFAQSKIDIGQHRKRKCHKELTILRKKKKELIALQWTDFVQFDS